MEDKEDDPDYNDPEKKRMKKILQLVTIITSHNTFKNIRKLEKLEKYVDVLTQKRRTTLFFWTLYLDSKIPHYCSLDRNIYRNIFNIVIQDWGRGLSCDLHLLYIVDSLDDIGI